MGIDVREAQTCGRHHLDLCEQLTAQIVHVDATTDRAGEELLPGEREPPVGPDERGHLRCAEHRPILADHAEVRPDAEPAVAQCRCVRGKGRTGRSILQ